MGKPGVGARGEGCLSAWPNEKAEEGRVLEYRLVKPREVKRSRGRAGSRAG